VEKLAVALASPTEKRLDGALRRWLVPEGSTMESRKEPAGRTWRLTTA
jgi:hypothetical protein